MIKAGDKLVTLANLINLDVLAERREQKRKELRLEIWKQENKEGNNGTH